MNELSIKALDLLKSIPEKPEYFTFDLTSNGFSTEDATTVIKDLEKSGNISITKEFINGNVGFILL